MIELRLVAYIDRLAFSYGDAIPESEPVLARDIEKGSKYYRLFLKEVSPVGDEPNTLMVHIGDPYLPKSASFEEFVRFHEELAKAVSLPVLHRDDFTHHFE